MWAWQSCRSREVPRPCRCCEDGAESLAGLGGRSVGRSRQQPGVRARLEVWVKCSSSSPPSFFHLSASSRRYVISTLRWSIRQQHIRNPTSKDTVADYFIPICRPFSVSRTATLHHTRHLDSTRPIASTFFAFQPNSTSARIALSSAHHSLDRIILRNAAEICTSNPTLAHICNSATTHASLPRYHQPAPPLSHPSVIMSAPSVSCFGKKKTATAVAHCKEGKGLIRLNGQPISLVQPEILRWKVFEPVLVVGEDKFS